MGISPQPCKSLSDPGSGQSVVVTGCACESGGHGTAISVVLADQSRLRSEATTMWLDAGTVQLPGVPMYLWRRDGSGVCVYLKRGKKKAYPGLQAPLFVTGVVNKSLPASHFGVDSIYSITQKTRTC